MNAEIIQNWLIAISFIVTTIVTIVLQIRINNTNKKNLLNQQLFELQRLSFINPHVENEDYTYQWNELKEKYKQGILKDKGLDDFLKYDVYTEMLFNFIYKSLEFYKTKKNLEKFIDFKSWINTHKYSWINPLQTNSNKDVYGDRMFNIVNSWIDW